MSSTLRVRMDVAHPPAHVEPSATSMDITIMHHTISKYIQFPKFQSVLTA
jgi:hypothetical protein